jgi:1,4-alpha-glucan branching enzyme
MTTGHSDSYAHNRFKTHINRFNEIAKQIKENRINERYIAQCRMEDNIFPEMDYRVYL